MFVRRAIYVVFALGLAACGKQAASGAPPANATGACRLLSTAEISSALSKSAVGVAETTREKYGITACEWSTASGSFAVQYWKSEHPSAANEAQSLASGVVDPLKAGAAANVRYETVSGVGEAAVAFIESKDDARGIMSDAAMLFVQQGDIILMLIAPELVKRDRAEALRALESLGKAAVGRMTAD
jgi:hypothetical protein